MGMRQGAGGLGFVKDGDDELLSVANEEAAKEGGSFICEQAVET
jgi:hypothetical protein